MKKLSRSVATATLLALAALTALRLQPWLNAAETAAPSEWQYAMSESRRKLEHKPSGHGTDSYYDKLWRQLRKNGGDPASERFQTFMRNSISNQEAALIRDLAQFHRSDSAYDRTWMGLVREGKAPGTPTFDRLLEKRAVRREVIREEVVGVADNLSDEVVRAKQAMELAQNKYDQALANYEDQLERMTLETPSVSGSSRQLRVINRRPKRRLRKRRLRELVLQSDSDQGKMVASTETAGDIQKLSLQSDISQAEIKVAEEIEAEIEESLVETETEEEPLKICGRIADVGSAEDLAALQEYSHCPELSKKTPILLLEGFRTHGRTGNNLLEFLHAIQEARDMGYILGVMYNSWATLLLLKMWMAIESDDWQEQFERAFCVKVFYDDKELEPYQIIHQDTKELLYYRSDIPLDKYIASQEYHLRNLFRNYNKGIGKDLTGKPPQDMCSGINALFGEDERSSVMYSVIHSRSLEGEPGFRLLGAVSRLSGCDPEAALFMKPDYIKAILEPLGMMKHPIAFITDGQNSEVLNKLMDDPEIGPLIRTVPDEASWIGGDLSLAVMSNVFIGNPASTFTGFIAKSRLALGFGHTYLYRAKDNNGKWRDVCDESCIFDKRIMRVQA